MSQLRKCQGERSKPQGPGNQRKSLKAAIIAALRAFRLKLGTMIRYNVLKYIDASLRRNCTDLRVSQHIGKGSLFPDRSIIP